MNWAIITTFFCRSYILLEYTTLPPWPMSLFGYHGAYYIHLPSAPPFANNSQHSTAYIIVMVQTHRWKFWGLEDLDRREMGLGKSRWAQLFLNFFGNLWHCICWLPKWCMCSAIKGCNIKKSSNTMICQINPKKLGRG